MYPAVGDFASAVKMFQKDIGDPATGVLTVSQIHKLGVRAEYQRLAPVGFPTYHHSLMMDGSAQVTGTFKILDEQIAWPVNYAKVACYKSQSYCELLMMDLILPKESDWVRQYSISQPNQDVFRVTRWDKHVIEAAPTSELGKCRTSTLSLNFKTKEFYQITKNAGGDCDILGVKMPKLDKPRISQIVDGKDIVQQEFRKIQETAYGYLSSEFRAQVERATRDSEPKRP
jgi:hypothetical protein